MLCIGVWWLAIVDSVVATNAVVHQDLLEGIKKMKGDI